MTQADRDLLFQLFGYEWKEIGRKAKKTIWDPRNELNQGSYNDGKDYDYSQKPPWTMLWHSDDYR